MPHHPPRQPNTKNPSLSQIHLGNVLLGPDILFIQYFQDTFGDPTSWGRIKGDSLRLPFGAFRGQLAAFRGQFGALDKLGCLEAYMGCLEINLGCLEANLGCLEVNLGWLEVNLGVWKSIWGVWRPIWSILILTEVVQRSY